MPSALEEVPNYELDKERIESSLFVLVIRLFVRLRPEPDEIEPLLKVRRSILYRSIFWLQDEDLLQLGSALGSEVTNWDLVRSACRDLTSAKNAQLHLCGTLRYCPTCLRYGWHSSLFQHWALPMCPVHSENLRTGCPACGKEIIANLVVMARAQMTCDSCGCVFRRGVDSKAERIAGDRLVALAFVPYRQALPQRFEYDNGSVRRVLATSDARTGADVRGRALQRFLVWPEHQLNGYRNWPVVACAYDRHALEPQSIELTLVDDQVARVLQEVGAILHAEGCMQDCPVALRNRSQTGARLDGSITLVAAAYWKTVRMYRIADYLASDNPGALPRVAPFGYACFASPEAWRQTLRFEVIGLVALTLLELRRSRFLIEVDWERRVPTETFLPAWRLLQFPSKFELQIRPRVSVDTLRRLIRRYAQRRLLEVPKDVSLLTKLMELERAKVDSEVKGGKSAQA